MAKIDAQNSQKMNGHFKIPKFDDHDQSLQVSKRSPVDRLGYIRAVADMFPTHRPPPSQAITMTYPTNLSLTKTKNLGKTSRIKPYSENPKILKVLARETGSNALKK